MNTVKLDGKELQRIANATPTAKVVAKLLQERQRLRDFSDIVRTKNALIRAGERIVEKDYNQFWDDLEKMDAGSIIYGRKNKYDRFQWHYSLKKVAEGMLEGKSVTGEKIVNEAPKVKTILRRKQAKEVATKPETVRAKSNAFVYVPLRNNFDVEIKVPNDLTKHEVEVLTRALEKCAI